MKSAISISIYTLSSSKHRERERELLHCTQRGTTQEEREREREIADRSGGWRGWGARLARSSTRYGSASTVFSGPVRKWKKRWVPLSTPRNNAVDDGSASRTHLLLFRWALVSSPDEPPSGSNFRYVPISVIEEQKQEATDAKNKPSVADPSLQTNQTDSSDTKPNMNNVAVEEAEASDKDDSNRTNLELNLGLKATDADRESKSKGHRNEDYKKFRIPKQVGEESCHP